MRKILLAAGAVVLMVLAETAAACVVPERAGELLEPKGYELVPDVRGWGVEAYYLKDGVFLHLEFGYQEDGQQVISGLTAYVLTTNVENVDF